ncbi:MAG TPA: peptidylprolyl isomerase [Planctomycetota bacterium]|jgi:hypothetical protein
MEMQDTLIVVNGRKINVQDVLIYLKASGVFRDAVCRLVEMEVIQDKARELGVEPSEAEFQDYASAKRRYDRLPRAEDLAAYCRANGVTLEQWNQIARRELLLIRIRARVIQDQDVQDYFNTNREQMKTVSLSRIVCASPVTAKDLLDRCLAGESFHDLARRHSMEEHTRAAGGYLGTVRRRMLAAKIEESVFSARVGDVLGPFTENSFWALYKVDSVREAELTHALRKELADKLFRDWLQRSIAASRFEKPR